MKRVSEMRNDTNIEMGCAPARPASPTETSSGYVPPAPTLSYSKTPTRTGPNDSDQNGMPAPMRPAAAPPMYSSQTQRTNARNPATPLQLREPLKPTFSDRALISTAAHFAHTILRDANAKSPSAPSSSPASGRRSPAPASTAHSLTQSHRGLPRVYDDDSGCEQKTTMTQSHGGLPRVYDDDSNAHASADLQQQQQHEQDDLDEMRPRADTTYIPPALSRSRTPPLSCRAQATSGAARGRTPPAPPSTSMRAPTPPRSPKCTNSSAQARTRTPPPLTSARLPSSQANDTTPGARRRTSALVSDRPPPPSPSRPIARHAPPPMRPRAPPASGQGRRI